MVSIGHIILLVDGLELTGHTRVDLLLGNGSVWLSVDRKLLC